MSESTGMKVSLGGVARNAARCIDAAIERLRASLSEDEFEDFCMAHNPQDSAFMLSELAEHAAETAKGMHTVKTFADFYCLAKEPR